MEEQLREVKLYSPLQGHVFTEWSDDYGEFGIELNGCLLADYMPEILEQIEKEKLPEEAVAGLMHYYHENDGVKQKVKSIVPTVENRNGTLYGVAICQVSGALSAKEMTALKDYCAGQYSDGWGEGLEQRAIKVEHGDLFLSFWQSEGFFIRTETELMRAQERGAYR